MEQAFKKYVSELIKMTFGFVPKIRVEIPWEGSVSIYVDGTENERKQIMGHLASNFYAIKQLIVCFSKPYKVYVYFHLEFHEGYISKN